MTILISNLRRPPRHSVMAVVRHFLVHHFLVHHFQSYFNHSVPIDTVRFSDHFNQRTSEIGVQNSLYVPCKPKQITFIIIRTKWVRREGGDSRWHIQRQRRYGYKEHIWRIWRGQWSFLLLLATSFNEMYRSFPSTRGPQLSCSEIEAVAIPIASAT